MPDRQFGDIHVDLVGPLTPSEGNTYLLTIVDNFTRWPEAVPLPNSEAVTCARALSRTWISRFGVPDSITSDQGRQFTSPLWRELQQVLGVRHNVTTAYHPQANGIVERFHRSLKAALKAHLDGPHWMDELAVVLLGIRSIWKDSINAALAQLVYGTNIRIPGDFLPPPVADKQVPDNNFVRELQHRLQKLTPPPPAGNGQPQSYIPSDLQMTIDVYVRHDAVRGPLVRPYDGPYPVLSRSDKSLSYSRMAKNTKSLLTDLSQYIPQDQKFLSSPACLSTQPQQILWRSKLQRKKMKPTTSDSTVWKSDQKTLEIEHYVTNILIFCVHMILNVQQVTF